MPEFDEENPFTIVLNGIWELLERNKAITDRVAFNNRIVYNSPKGNKQVSTKADRPQVDIMPSGITANMPITSSSVEIMKRYDIVFSQGNLQLLDDAFGFNKLEWEVFRSLADWQGGGLCALTWQNFNFVTRANLLSGDVSRINELFMTQSTRQWIAAWTLNVSMHFPVQLIQVMDFEA